MGSRVTVRGAFAAAVLTTALAAASLVVAPVASAVPPGYQLRSVSVSVPAGGYLRQRVGCPSGTVPVNGGVSTTSPVGDSYTRLQGSAPRLLAGGADTGWEVALHNDAGGTRYYRVYAVCIATPPGYQLSIARLPVAAHTASSAQVMCPGGKDRLGGGVSLDGTSYFSDRNIAITELAAAFPEGWGASIRNDDGTPLDAVVWVACANRSTDFLLFETHVRVTVQQVVFGTPAKVVTVSCPPDSILVGGGAWPPGGHVNTRIMTSAPTPDGRGWTITLRNYMAFVGIQYDVFAYCVA